RNGVVPEGMDALLAKIQHTLFGLGAELAARDVIAQPPRIADSDVTKLEREIDQYDAMVEPLRAFILPGGAAAAAQLHVARCICRRAGGELGHLMGGGRVCREHAFL